MPILLGVPTSSGLRLLGKTSIRIEIGKKILTTKKTKTFVKLNGDLHSVDRM